MKPVLFILFYISIIGISYGDFRQHQEFKVADVKRKSSQLIDLVSKERWISLNVKNSALSVTVSKDKHGVYLMVFVTRHEGVNYLDKKTVSRQKISFVAIPGATDLSRLSAKGVSELEDALSRFAGPFKIMNESTYDKNKKPVASIQKVSCSVPLKKEVVALIESYFAHVDQKLTIWEDSN